MAERHAKKVKIKERVAERNFRRHTKRHDNLHMAARMARGMAALWRPTMHRMRAWQIAMHPSLLLRGSPRLGRLRVALSATTISSKPHFSLLTIFLLSPFPIPLVIPSLRPRVRFQLGRVRSSGFGLDFAPRTEFS